MTESHGGEGGLRFKPRRVGGKPRIDVTLGSETTTLAPGDAIQFAKKLLRAGMRLDEKARSQRGRNSRRTGRQFEADIVKLLRTNGFPGAVGLKAPSEDEDRGDVGNVPGVTIECKAQQEFKVSLWLDQARRAAQRADTRWYGVVAKRRGLGVRESVVFMPLHGFVDLVRAALDSGPGLRGVASRELRP